MPSINLGPMDDDIDSYDYDLDELPESPGWSERGLETDDHSDDFYTVEGKDTVINSSRYNDRAVPDDLSDVGLDTVINSSRYNCENDRAVPDDLSVVGLVND